MRKSLLLAAGLVLSFSPAFADTTSLKAALEAAYQTNQSLIQARANQKITDEGLVTAASGLLPNVTGNAAITVTRALSGGGSTTYSDSASITASMLIWDGGQTRDGIEAAELAVLAGRQNLIETEQNILLSAISAFMDLRRSQAQLELAENNIRVLREQLRASEDRFEVGEVTRTDVALTQARLAASISGREASKAAVLADQANYEAIIGRKPHRLAAPSSGPKLPATANAAEAIAVRSHPSVLAAALNLEASEIELRRANKNKLPVVRGSLSASTGHTQTGGGFGAPTTTTSAGISATIPLYQGGQLASTRRAALAGVDLRKAQLDGAVIAARANLRRAYANWVAAKSAIAARQSQIRASQVAFEGVTEEAKLGARTTLDVLDAEQELQSARSDLVSALRDEKVAAYSVLAEMGLLNAANLNLNVARYDPSANVEEIKTLSPLGNKRLNLLKTLEDRR